VSSSAQQAHRRDQDHHKLSFHTHWRCDEAVRMRSPHLFTVDDEQLSQALHFNCSILQLEAERCAGFSRHASGSVRSS
jgi:hypothetical protein